MHVRGLHGAWYIVILNIFKSVRNCRKGYPFQGPKLGSCLTLGNELSKETHVLTKQEILLGKGTWVESRRVREPRSRLACSLGFYGDGISFRVVFSRSFWFRVLPGCTALVHPRWMPERRILGGDRTGGVSFWPFLNSSGWWRLLSSMFLTRTSCRKTTHANGYYGAWPGWALSISVLPLKNVCSLFGPGLGYYAKQYKQLWLTKIIIKGGKYSQAKTR